MIRTPIFWRKMPRHGPTLTLVTCSTYENADNPRLLLHGVLEPTS